MYVFVDCKFARNKIKKIQKNLTKNVLQAKQKSIPMKVQMRNVSGKDIFFMKPKATKPF
jgi:hypothetical protein